MCNEFAQERAWREYSEMMQREALKIITPEQPDLPLGSIRPSEKALVFTGAADGLALDLLPWGWKNADGKGLVLWLRSENRKDPPSARGIAPLTKFYEFRGDKPPKEKWDFRAAINEPIGMAVTLRDGRWAHLTTEPGPDVAPIHHRQPAILRLSDWPRFLADPAWPGDLMVPTPAGTLKAVQVR
jgi:putative SOS response-associated peptidase YedK